VDQLADSFRPGKMTMRQLLPTLLLLLLGPPAHADDKPYDVVVKGSDTIGGELGPALAKGWEALHPGKRVSWQALGSKTAFVGLFDSSADIGAASRPINAEEIKQAGQLGIKLQELVIGYDGLSIIVHPSNNVPSLSLTQLSDLFTGRITNWKELGGADLPVELVARPTYSGTRSFFDEKALRRGDPKGPEQLSPSAKALEKNEEIVPFVESHPGAIAYVGLAAVSKKVRVVPLALIPGGPAKRPDPAAVRDGSYPLYRALYLYTRSNASADAADLVRFVLSASGQDIVSAIGFVRVELSGEVRVTQRGVETGADGQAAPPVRVFFRRGSVSLTNEARKQLAQVASALTAGQRLLIVGHADGKGSAESNQRVSRARADAVAAYLRTLSVDDKSFEVRGAGADSPLASNETSSGRDRNRRVDVYVTRR
jgi:phosphate binding protein